MKIRNYICVVLVVGLIGIEAAAQTRSGAQRRRPETARGTRVAAPQGLSAAEITSALDTSLATTCAQTAPAAPRAISHDAAVFSPNRVASTLHGVWIGKVSGEYDPQLLAKDGFLNVDYYMLVDTRRGEAFVYQEFTDKRSGAGLTAKEGAPVWTYVWCARENYQTKSPRQVHSFTKVSDNLDDGRAILTNSTGLQFAATDRVVLEDVWKKLVAAKFFDDTQRSIAYAGVLFNPLTMGNVTSAGGGALFELRMVGEYRGIGQTAAQFVPGEPIHNVEQGRFLGVSAGPTTATARRQRGRPGTITTTAESGDYLVTSTELANEMEGPKDDAVVAVFSTQMAFDKVVIGPLSSGSGSPTAAPAAAAAPAPKAGPSARAGAGNKQRRAHR